MSEDRENYGPYRPGSPDPTLLTRQAAVDLEVRLLREIGLLEKLVDQRFREADKLATALNVAHEAAIAKSEASFTREIESLKTLATANTGAMTDRINALQRVVDRGEGSSEGSLGSRRERRAEMGSSMQMASFAVAIMALILAGFVAAKSLPGSPAVPVTVAPQPSALK